MHEVTVPPFMLGGEAGPHTFFLDFDGTLYPGESLEEVLALALADDRQQAAQTRALEELGRRGMEGTLPFEESLRGRLKIVRPHRRHIDAWVAGAERQVLPMWTELLAALRGSGHRVLVLSGGFRSCIEPVVAGLGVEPADVYCNNFLFGDDGWVVGLDEDQPLSRTGGKPHTVRALDAKRTHQGLRIMIGDGATDLEAVAEGACHGMMGYGVHSVRSTVQEHADIFFDRAEEFDRFLRAHFL